MSVFSKIGNFFKGTFGGNDDEEEKRKRQQQAQQQQQQDQQRKQQQSQQQSQQQVRSVNDLFTPKNSSADPLNVTKTPTPPTTLQQLKQTTPLPKPPAPHDEQFKAFTAEKKVRKFLPDQVQIDTNRDITTNKDKYVAEFDKLNKDTKKELFSQIKDKAKAGDVSAKTAYDALVSTNRAPAESFLQNAADVASLPGRNILRVGTGYGQAASGLVDLVSPGQDTNRFSKALDSVAKKQDKSARDAGIDGAYKVGNAAAEIGSYLIPAVGAAKLATNLPKGAKLTEKTVALISSKVEKGGDANKVRRFLADRMRRGMTLEEAIQETAISSKYVGENASKGNDTSPTSVLTDVATGVGGSLLFPAKLVKGRLRADDAATNALEDTVGSALAGAGEAIDKIPAYQRGYGTPPKSSKEIYQEGSRATRGEGSTFYDMEKNGLNPGDVNDIPAYARKNADDNIKKAEGEIAGIDRQLTNTPEQTVEDYSFNQKKQLADDIAANPSAKDALIKRHNQRIQAAQRLEVLQKYRQQLIDRKAQLTKSIEDSQAIKDKTAELVAKQGEQASESVKAGQDAAQQADEVKQAQTTPAPKDVVQDAPVTGNPEVTANDAYQADTNAYSDIGFDKSSGALSDELMKKMGYDLTQKGRVNPLSKLFGAIPRAQAAVGDKLSDITNKVLTSGSNSGNSITSKLAQAPRPIWSRFGMSNEARASLDALNGLKNTAQDVGLRVSRRRNEVIKKLINNGADPNALRQTLHQVFETPDFLKRMYGDGVENLSPNQLPPELKQIVDEQIDLNKLRNDINFKTGVIDEATYFQGTDGMHTPRVYGFDFAKSNKNTFKKGSSSFDSTAGITRNELSDVPDEIFNTALDPLAAQDIRFQQSLMNKARVDAIDTIVKNFKVSDSKVNSGFTKLVGEQYGALNGKFVDNQVVAALQKAPIFKTNFGQKADDLLNVWRDSPFGTADRFAKQTKTVGSVGTHVGNVGSNVTLFSTGAGVDPVTALTRGLGGARTLISDGMGGFNPDLYALKKAGIINSNSGKALNGIPEKDLIKIESLLTEAEKISGKNPNLATKTFGKAWGLLQDVYGGTDDAFKLGIYRELRARGIPEDTALRRVREQFQNYDNVGHGVNFAADSPVLGKPFARFLPELTRISKNTVKNNSVGLGLGLAGAAKVGDELSNNAGESPEERARREGALGQTKLPGTSSINKAVTGRDSNISLNFAVGDSSVNAARSLGLNFPIDTSGDPNKALINQLTPVTVPTREDAGGHTVFAPEETVSSMALNPVARLFANRDFMGRRITDPENKVRYEGNGQTRYKYENPDGTPMDDSKNSNYNRAKALGISYLPFSSEVDALQSGIRDTKDFYGKDRTLSQSIARLFGVKVENNNQEARDKKASQEKYYEDKLPAIQNFLDTNPDLAESYWKLKNTARDRYTDVSQNDNVSPERYGIIAADKSGRLFNFMRDQHIANAKEKGTEIDPIYTLPQDEANQVVKLKAMYTGDDVKFQQLLYKNEWFKGYKDADRKYQANKPEQEDFPGAAKTNARPEEWYGLSENLYGDNGVITKYPLIKQYQDTLEKNFPGDKYDSDERKAFTKSFYANHPDYNDLKAGYEAERLAIVNKMREIEGAPPLSADVWSGKFETDSDKASKGFGSGFGFGGGRGSGLSDTNNLGKLSNFGNSVKGLDPAEAQAMQALAPLFAKLNAGGGTGRAKPRVGASSSGR